MASLHVEIQHVESGLVAGVGVLDGGECGGQGQEREILRSDQVVRADL